MQNRIFAYGKDRVSQYNRTTFGMKVILREEISEKCRIKFVRLRPRFRENRVSSCLVKNWPDTGVLDENSRI